MRVRSLAIEPRASELAGFYVDSVCVADLGRS